VPEPTPAAEPVAVEPAPEAPPAAPPGPEAPAPAAVPAGGLTLVDVRRLWPDIVDATKLRRRVAWMHLTQNCQVVAVDGQTLTLGFTNAGARDSFVNGGCDDVLRQAAIDVVGTDWRIETIIDPGARADAPVVTTPATHAPDPAPEAVPESRRASDPESIAAARDAIQQTRSGDEPRADAPDWAAADADAHPDDIDADQQGMTTAELLQRELGAQMIEEIRHQ
jgi:DNA polymerase-3 subunit gamma/tau